MSLAGVAAAGALAGAIVMLSLPAPGVRLDRSTTQRAPRLSKIPATEIDTLLAWTPTRLPSGFSDSATSVAGIRAAAEVKSGIGWVSSWTPLGGNATKHHSGYQVPVEVAAVDPEQYLKFVPPSERSTFAEIAGGGALLSRTGSAMRGIGAGGSLSIREATIFIHGVVDDELMGAHEVLVSNSIGEQLGIARPRYLLIAMEPGANRSDVESELRQRLPSSTRLRLRAPGETPVFRHGDAVLPLSSLKTTFGEFAARPAELGQVDIDPGWVAGNITTSSVSILGSVQCHRAIFPQLKAALSEIATRGLEGRIDSKDFGGCFSPRALNSDLETGLSHHSWGVAFDLNVGENPFGAEPRIDPRVVEVMERWGFTWGGRWLVPDGMHFEFIRWPLSPKG